HVWSRLYVGYRKSWVSSFQRRLTLCSLMTSSFCRRGDSYLQLDSRSSNGGQLHQEKPRRNESPHSCLWYGMRGRKVELRIRIGKPLLELSLSCPRGRRAS